MKKIIALLSILAFSTSVNAENLNEVNSYDATVNKIEDTQIYDVEIKWDNMMFTYNNTESYVWNSKTHEYDLKNKKTWENEKNKITINNKSNYEIEILFNYESYKDYQKITGVFSKNKLNIQSKESDFSELNLSGKLDENTSEYKKIGEVTVTIF